VKHAAFVEEAAGQLDAGERRLEVLGVQACGQERVAGSVREHEPVRSGCPKRSKSFAWTAAVKLEILINRTELGVFSALRASHLPQAEGLLGCELGDLLHLPRQLTSLHGSQARSI
jgi:hypothetical protein